MRLRSDGRVTIPKHLRHEAGLCEGDELEAEATRDGILLRPRQGRDPEQWWFWTEEWQAMEREIEADLAAGERGTVFASGEGFLAALHEIAASGSPNDAAPR
jgi:AbrB family looped-hinge helix DNA binding protein